MTATLTVVLDQLASPVDADLASASRELARALVRTAPAGCEIAALMPAGADVAAVVEREVPGTAEIVKTTLPRRELAAAWQLGIASGAPAGMIHSPTLMAPLVRHDRIHDHDQTVVTLWDLAAWEHPHEVGRASVAWHKAMLKRAARFADAIVVPTHAAAERLAEMCRAGDRVRVIAGAAPAEFAVPVDEVGRRRALEVPDGALLLAGSSAPSRRLPAAFAAIAEAGSDLPVTVIDVPDGDEDAVRALAEVAGLPADRVHVAGVLEPADRAAVMAAAVALVAPRVDTAFPWRVVEALALGVPVVAAGSLVHRQVVVDGGLLTDADRPDDEDALAVQLTTALASSEAVQRLATLSGDRGRAFSWNGAAERVWQLHADL